MITDFFTEDVWKVVRIEDKLLENEMTVAPGHYYDKGDEEKSGIGCGF